MKKILSLALLLSVTASVFAVEAEILRWRNGAPVFQGFSKVAPGEGAVWGDLNTDGVVDVADIANIIDIMAGK